LISKCNLKRKVGLVNPKMLNYQPNAHLEGSLIMGALGMVEGVFLCRHDDVASEKVEKLKIMPEGIVGDRHWGATRLATSRDKPAVMPGTLVDNDRQITIASSEELEAISSQLVLAISPATIARLLGVNILISGIPNFTALAGSANWRLKFVAKENDAKTYAVINLTGVNRPCTVAGAQFPDRYAGENIATRFVKVAWNTRGVTGKFFSAGLVHKGLEARLIPVAPGP
jgi:hypothetical protein